MCTSLTEITIPLSVNSIGNFAFQNCKRLKKVTIPRSKINIELDAFVLGRYCTGKSYILQRYINNIYVFSKCFNINGNKVYLDIWDTPGDEKSYGLIKSYYINTDFVIIVIDLTCYQSFDYSIKLLKESLEYGPMPVIILGNKCDIIEKSEKVIQELEKIKKEYNVKYFEVSAKFNINIEEAFQYVISEISNYYFL